MVKLFFDTSFFDKEMARENLMGEYLSNNVIFSGYLYARNSEGYPSGARTLDVLALYKENNFVWSTIGRPIIFNLSGLLCYVYLVNIIDEKCWIIYLSALTLGNGLIYENLVPYARARSVKVRLIFSKFF